MYSELTETEIACMYSKEFDTPRLETVRNIFIFSCYTGLAYIDVKGLTKDMLKRWPDGNMWISCHRKKTKVPVNVRLLDVPLQIFEKYKDQVQGNKVLPVPTNQKCNDYLKEIADLCGINKNLNFHMAKYSPFYKWLYSSKLGQQRRIIGYDKKTSEVPYSSLFCIKSNEHYSVCMDSIIFLINHLY